MKPELKKELFTIPNLLTLIRVVSVPFIMYFILKSQPITGLIILILSSSTDLVDGYIARKFNQVSEFGKAFDPFADKLMQCGTILSLTIICYVHWIFVVLLLLKELVMILGGLYLVKNKKIIQANKKGKYASFVLTIALFLTFFHPFFADKVFYLDWIVLGVGMVMTYIAFYFYLKDAFVKFKEIKDGN